jgi:hypothetical protein
MLGYEEIITEGSKHRLTITADRVTLKLKKDAPPETKEYLRVFAQKTADILQPKITQTLRGEWNNFDSLGLKTSARTAEHRTWTWVTTEMLGLEPIKDEFRYI